MTTSYDGLVPALKECTVRATSIFLYVAGLTFLVVDGVYVAWNLLIENFEVIGTITVGLSGLMCVMVAFYLGRLVRGVGPTALPEDSQTAEIDDGDPEVGHFSPWSWWPILLAGSLAIVVLGLAISPWITFIGAPLLIVALVGWVFEHYRGYFAR
jgi:hypothetical protein